jgi:hypothetical protein
LPDCAVVNLRDLVIGAVSTFQAEHLYGISWAIKIISNIFSHVFSVALVNPTDMARLWKITSVPHMSAGVILILWHFPPGHFP